MIRALAAAALAALAACAIDSRSELYQCDALQDCSNGRVCRAGWCVVPGDDGPGRDAGVSIPDAAGTGTDQEPDASTCPAACTSCDDGACQVDCRDNDSCRDLIVCPPDLPCTVICDGTDSCASGVDCSAASSCDVRCTSPRACSGRIECGDGSCEVTCDARDTCAGGIDCADSCSCETSCSGSRSCDVAPDCPLFFCSDGLDCDADDLECDLCAG